MPSLLAAQIVLVLGGGSGAGLRTARLARANGAAIILTAPDADRLYVAGRELDAKIAAFELTDVARLVGFFAALGEPVDHVVLIDPGPRRDAHLVLPRLVARNAAGRIRPGGSLLFVGAAAALPALTRQLAGELAPIRVNLIAVRSADADVAALALHLLTGTGVTGATFDAG
jgi:NAD(P)-dependent dehydrogenase (short-subunit alcohol dehydrogenase family)